jgi:hypothetical protein
MLFTILQCLCGKKGLASIVDRGPLCADFRRRHRRDDRDDISESRELAERRSAQYAHAEEPDQRPKQRADAATEIVGEALP